MLRRTFFVALALFLGAATAVNAQERTQPVRGGLRIGDFSVSVGHQEYRQYRDTRGYLVRRNVWVSNQADSYGYVKMNHRQQYELRLGSSHFGRCDAKIEIDGKEIGTFRVQPNSAVIIERSVKDRGRLTFLRNGTREYFDARLDRIPANKRGLVQVTFYPERTRFRATDRSDVPHPTTEKSYGAESVRSGGTGLTGRSDQDFRNAGRIERDYANAITISLRLVEETRFRVRDNDVRPLEDVRNYGRTTVPRNNPVPPPVER